MNSQVAPAAQIACPVCSGDQFKSLFVKAGESFVRCESCTLTLINPPPDLANSTATYDENYSEAYIVKSEKKLKRTRKWVRRMQRRFVRRGRWLDVGCSAGFVVKAASEAGFDAHGVEVEAAAVDYARTQLSLANVRCGYLEDQAYSDGEFDVISLYDVIEHVPDLNQLVIELERILSPDGVIEIRTPNISHWSTPRDLASWKEIKPSEHLYYFNRKTLIALFAKHGFTCAYRRPMFKGALNCFFAKRR